MWDMEDSHYVNGRTLVVEYAGADAIRHSAPKSAKPVNRLEHKGRGSRRARADNHHRNIKMYPPTPSLAQLLSKLDC